jgi:hypothetical protein
MSNLVATPIVDKLGRASTRHKNLDGPAPTNSRANAVVTPIASATSYKPHYGASTLELEPNENAPFPQANSLSKVAAVADMIGRGATTPEAIALGVESNSKSDRAGSYYGDAIVYLGLAEKVSEDGLPEYELTGKGQEFVALDPDTRQDVLAQSIGNLDLVQIYRQEGEEELRKYVGSLYGYADSTIDRRVACISSWSDQAEADDLGEDIAFSQDTMSRFTSDALEIVARQKREAREAAAISARKEAVGEVCTDCFMVKSSGGQCGCE